METISPAVIAGYVLAFLSTLLCVAWGLLKWNTSGSHDEPAEEVAKWAAEEDQEKRK